MENDFTWGQTEYVVWKRSQYLMMWEQRLLKMIKDTTIATAREQNVKGTFQSTFSINCADINKVTIFPRTKISGDMMVPVKIEYARTTWIAEKDMLMIHLFGTITKGKLILIQKEGMLQKAEIKGHEMNIKEPIQSSFIVYREDGVINKEFRMEQMIVTWKRIMTYHKMGFGKNATAKPDWSIDRKDIKRLSTKFEIYKNNLIINLTYKWGSCQFAVPAHGDQLYQIMKMVCNTKDGQMSESQFNQ